MRPGSVVDGGGVSRGESPAVGLRTLCNSGSVSVWRIRYRHKRDGVVLKRGSEQGSRVPGRTRTVQP
jgi:hypothetical protein